MSQLVTKQIQALLKFVSIQVRTIQSGAPWRGATNPRSRQAGLVQAAQTQTEREFQETVDAAVPGLHLERNAHVEFWVPCSLAKVIERCLNKAKVLTLSDSRTDAVELIFSEFDLRHPAPERELEAECQAVS